MGVDILYIRIKRAIESNRECFLCTLEDETEREYMDTYLSELIMVASSRQKIVQSRGFCNYHSYKMLIASSKPESSDSHGMALIMKSVTEGLVEDLRKKESRDGDSFREFLVSENKCPACVHLSKFMEMYVKEVVNLLSSDYEEFSKFFEESKGLCMPHFITLTRMTEETARDQRQRIIKTINEVEVENLERLNTELAEYIRRQSYEFSERDRAAVEDTVLRSVEKIAGRRGVKISLSRKTCWAARRALLPKLRSLFSSGHRRIGA